jgi:hypothetical protein
MKWLRRWRERNDRNPVKSAPQLPEIDPIEELARIVGEAQERDGEDERQFETNAKRSAEPIKRHPSRTPPFSRRRRRS